MSRERAADLARRGTRSSLEREAKRQDFQPPMGLRFHGVLAFGRPDHSTNNVSPTIGDKTLTSAQSSRFSAQTETDYLFGGSHGGQPAIF